MPTTPLALEQLIRQLSKLPSLGPRSAQRVALHMLTKPDVLQNLQRQLQQVQDQVVLCEQCGNVGVTSPCHICTDSNRDPRILCLVEHVDDLWAMERTAQSHHVANHLSQGYNGQFHVMGGVVSALEGRRLEDLRMPQLRQRLERLGTEHPIEVISALSNSVDGQTTFQLVKQQCQHMPHITFSQLAQGVPLGGRVDYLDEGTLGMALAGRRVVA